MEWIWRQPCFLWTLAAQVILSFSFTTCLILRFIHSTNIYWTFCIDKLIAIFQRTITFLRVEWHVVFGVEVTEMGYFWLFLPMTISITKSIWVTIVQCCFFFSIPSHLMSWNILYLFAGIHPNATKISSFCLFWTMYVCIFDGAQSSTNNSLC